MLVLFFLRGPEDTWICGENGWVKHGVPSAPMPTEPCGERSVKLYYYNYDLDKDETGNAQCSREGLTAVERKIPLAGNLIKNTIELLLKGDLTGEEKAQGIATEYPLPGFSLKNTSLENGVLTLTFNDLNNKSGGGSCRVGVLWFQIEATAKQFSGVQEVRFWPEEIFQP